jgi:hypothetical protein
MVSKLLLLVTVSVFSFGVFNVIFLRESFNITVKSSKFGKSNTADLISELK